MKNKKRRSTSCHNCGSELKEEYNFCPVCGQSNTDNNITFWILIKEFVDNYLGIDSKMAHSALPFMFNPGALTNRFQEGRIKHFIHPVRLYLVMSLFYFFTISYLLSGFDLRTIDEEAEYTSAGLNALRNDENLQLLADSVRIKLVDDSLVQRYDNISSFGQLYDSIKADFSEDDFEDLNVSLRGIDIPRAEEESTVERLHRIARDRRVTDEAFMDTLSIGWDNSVDSIYFSDKQIEHMSKQVRKIFVNDQGFKGFVLGNLPLMMFILIPLFAGILKLFYLRRKHLYIKHIVHSLHLHSFSYLIYAIGLLIMFKIITENNFPNANITAIRGILTGVFFIISSTYAYISFRKVYKQGWFKTLVKFNVVGILYAIFLNIFFWLEIGISFWYY